MASGDWSATCKMRPTSILPQYDNAKPPNITLIDVNYLVMQSDEQIAKLYVWTPAAPIPVAQGLTAIQNAIQAAMNYEGLGVG